MYDGDDEPGSRCDQRSTTQERSSGDEEYWDDDPPRDALESGFELGTTASKFSS